MKTFKQFNEELKSISLSEEEIIEILSDESIDESIREEIFFYYFSESGVDWDAAGKGFAQGLSFGYAPKIKAKAKSLWKGTKYKDELEKEKSEYEKAKERSPGTYATGEVGSMFVPAGGAVLGVAKAVKAARGAVIGARAANQANKAANAAKQVSNSQKALGAAQKAYSADKTGKNISNVAKAEKSVSKAMEKERLHTDKMKSLQQRANELKSKSILRPTKGKVLGTVAGAAALTSANKGISPGDVAGIGTAAKRAIQGEQGSAAKPASQDGKGSAATQQKLLPGVKQSDDLEKAKELIKKREASVSPIYKVGNVAGKLFGGSKEVESGVADTYSRLAKDPKAAAEFLKIQQQRNKEMGVK